MNELSGTLRATRGAAGSRAAQVWLPRVAWAALVYNVLVILWGLKADGDGGWDGGRQGSLVTLNTPVNGRPVELLVAGRVRGVTGARVLAQPLILLDYLKLLLLSRALARHPLA